MRVDEKTADLLGKLGLNKYEIDAYVALVSGGKLTASEVSSASDIPGARVYDIMDSLEKKGFVNIGIGRPTTYSPVPPEEALTNYRDRLKREFERDLSKFNENSDALLSSLEPLWEKDLSRKKPHEVFSVREDEDIPTSIDKALRRSDSSVWILTDDNITTYLTSEHEGELDEAASKGVSFRILTSSDPSDSARKKFRELGSLKTLANPPCSFFLVDGKRLLLIRGVGDLLEEVRGTLLWTNSGLLTSVFNWTFDQLWESAKS